jgi:hypothetical protein
MADDDGKASADTCSRIHKYQLGPTIGIGTFGKFVFSFSFFFFDIPPRVKQARNSATGDLVAMKILEKELIVRNRMAEQLRREVCFISLMRTTEISPPLHLLLDCDDEKTTS